MSVRRTPRRRVARLLLGVCALGSTLAWADGAATPEPARAGAGADPSGAATVHASGARNDPRPGTADGGQRAGPTLSAEDREVVENLELLENLDQAKDLDLMVELSHD